MCVATLPLGVLYVCVVVGVHWVSAWWVCVSRCLTCVGLLALCLRRLCDPVCLSCVFWTGHAWCAVSLPELALYLHVGT